MLIEYDFETRILIKANSFEVAQLNSIKAWDAPHGNADSTHVRQVAITLRELNCVTSRFFEYKGS